MKKIVIIGANDFQNPLILKAKALGYETHVFAWKDGAVGEETADYFYPISITEKEQILEACRKIHPDAVVSIGSDLAVLTVVYLQRHLGMKGNSEHSARISTNKYEMRKALEKAGIKVPGFKKITEANQAAEMTDAKKNLSLPVIVKPTDRSGSRGIMKLMDWTGLEEAVRAAQGDSFEHAAIVEEYLEGEEFSCESISWEGSHHCLAVTKKYTTGYPHFIETGHMEPAELSPNTYEKIYDSVKKALDALEIKFGASHAEFKLDDRGEIHIIEVGARMGGDCIGSHLVELSTGYDYLKMVLDVALGREPERNKVSEGGTACVKFLFDQKDLQELEQIKERHGDKLRYISEIDFEEEHLVTDSSNRYGYYIMCFESPEEARSILKL